MKCVCIEGHTGPKGNGKMRRYKDNITYDISKAHYKEYEDYFVKGVPEPDEVVQSISLRDAGELGMVKSSGELKDFKMTDLREIASASGIKIPGDVKSKDGIIELLKPIFDK